MTWTAPQSALRDYCITRCRIAAVATQAGVAAATWASSSLPRVFDAAEVGHLAACRLPLVTVAVAKTPYDPESIDGGMHAMQATIEVHIGGKSGYARQAQAERIMAACLAAIRSNGSDNYGFQGGVDVEEFDQAPLWGVLKAELEFEFSYGRDDYGLKDV